MSQVIASGDWPERLPPREMLFAALWKSARRVAATFEFAGNVIKADDLVAHGQVCVMSYAPDELQFLVPTVRRDMLDESERLMRLAGWDYDRTAKQWFRRRDDMGTEASWLFGYHGDNDQDSDVFTKHEGTYPALVALARANGNVTQAHQDYGCAKNTFYKRLANERLAAVNDAEFLVLLKADT